MFSGRTGEGDICICRESRQKKTNGNSLNNSDLELKWKYGQHSKDIQTKHNINKCLRKQLNGTQFERERKTKAHSILWWNCSAIKRVVSKNGKPKLSITMVRSRNCPKNANIRKSFRFIFFSQSESFPVDFGCNSAFKSHPLAIG